MNIKKLNNNNFQFNNLHLKNKSNFSLTLLKKNKRFKKFKTYLRYPIINVAPILDLPKISNTKQNKPSLSNLDFFIKKDHSALNEVLVKGKIKYKNKPRRVFSLLKGIKVKDLPYKNLKILDYLKLKGFNINESLGQVSISNGRGFLSFHYNLTTKVFLDEIPLQSEKINNLDLISNSDVSDYEEIFISKTLHGEIHLYSNTNKKNKNIFTTFKIPLGYANSKEYYQPKYNSNISREFKNYGAIYWEPNINLLDNTFLLKFNHLKQKRIKLFIEGISDDGSLIMNTKDY